MSGSKEFPKKGQAVILDTHVWTAAAGDASAIDPVDASKLVERVITACAHVSLSSVQIKELMPHLTRLGHRYPQFGVPILSRLRGHPDNKLRSIPASSMKRLPKDLNARFNGNLKDDVHLYEAARVAGAVVVTEDPGQLRLGPLIAKRIGIEVRSLAQALGDDETP